MKAYIPVAFGWYKLDVISVDDFAHKIADDQPLDEDIIKQYEILLHYTTNLAGYICIDQYDYGIYNIEASQSYGKNFRIYHEVVIAEIDWNSLPDWAEWATIDADGRFNIHNQEPQRFKTAWGAPVAAAKRFLHKQNPYLYKHLIDFPFGVDWRLLKEKRPS